jgi:23S rRNA (adenine2503-C2)-methyltransferase
MLQLKNYTASEIHERLAHLGVKPRLARLVQVSAVRRSEYPAPVPGISPRVLAEVQLHTTIPNLTLVEKAVSPTDGFCKYLFCGSDSQPFEAVRIPLLHRPDNPKFIVCVSSQVGCAMGCEFCATGRMGFRRQLATWEIVDQVSKVQADSPHPVRGVVFMGMGEPFHNYDAVIQAARILAEPCGMAIAAKSITISTVGIVPAIRRFIAERHEYRLIVSLTSADPQLRAELLPVERAYPTSELMAAVREYYAVTGRRIILAWTMISGWNTRPEDARELASLTAGQPIQLDLIDVNDPTGRFQPPSLAEYNAFRGPAVQRRPRHSCGLRHAGRSTDSTPLRNRSPVETTSTPEYGDVRAADLRRTVAITSASQQ